MKTLKNIIWVESDDVLNPLCEQWQLLSFIAIDTEFMRTSTYYPLPALIQVYDGDANYLIDPTKIQSFAAFAALLTHEPTTKVLHACSEDIEVFLHLVGHAPRPIFDTQIAAGLCGFGYSRGYAKLVESILGIDLPKEETRSDWLQRPLTEPQKHYAACDVEYLHSIYQTLCSTLQQRQRLSWATTESQRFVDQIILMQDPELAYTKFKAAWRLKPRNFALLKTLVLWRELTAQQRDVPRSRVLDNKSIFAIAETLPKHLNQLRGIDSLHESAIRRHGKHILEQVESVQALGLEKLPVAPPRPPSKDQQKLVKQLREAVDALANELDIAPEILATRKDLETVIQMHHQQGLPGHLAGWRAPILQRALDSFKGNAA